MSRIAPAFKIFLWSVLFVACLAGPGLARDGLFETAYTDCPPWGRLRDGQISGLAVTRGADDEHTVNVTWEATRPHTWRMGPRSFDARLVLLLDDGDGPPAAQALALGTRTAAFDGVRTGTEVRVELGVVVETDGDAYLVSDVVGATIDQSISPPTFFTTNWKQGVAPHLVQTPIAGGTFYYVGYNEAFGNYRAASGLLTRPQTPRLRIGLAHGSETLAQRDTVDFDTYVIRIVDEDGDVVPEGDDVSAMMSMYGAKRLVTWCIMQDLSGNTERFSNLRIVDDGDIRASMFWSSPAFVLDPVSQAVPFKEVILQDAITPVAGVPVSITAAVTPDRLIEDSADANTFLYALPPDAHRDFPIDVLASDVTYTLSAWAVNGDGETISPVATLRVRPQDRAYGDASNVVQDYVSLEEIVGGPNEGKNAAVSRFVVTAFTVLK